MTASVEVIFDNSDRRIAIEKNEISLRRVIGAKKDQYILNKNVITRNEVVSLLETAGFSKSNPYYIIQQGKINEVATTSEFRLMLLKEIAGVHVYEDKRNESLSILNDTQTKIKNIEEVLETINEKLKVLKNEKKELKEFQDWDRKMRTIEYIIYDRELSINKENINKIKTLHADLKKEQAELRNTIEKLSNEIKDVNHNLKRIQRNIELTEEEKDSLSKELEKLLAEKESHSIKLDDIQLDIKLGTENQESINKELEVLNADIEKTQKELEEIKPKYENTVKIGEEIIRKLDSLEQNLQILYTRQGRGAQYKTKEERNAWINRELALIDEQVGEKKKHIHNLEERIGENDLKHCELEKHQQHIINGLGNEYNAVNKYRQEFNEANKKKDEFSAKKKDLWKKEKDLQNNITYLEEDLRKINQDMISRFGKGIFNGIKSVNKVLKTFSERADMIEKLHQYYGLVVERFTSAPALYRAIEVTAGSRLLHHIVTEAKFGQEILREMNRQGLPGVVSFLPLDRLKVEATFYPRFENAIPLISQLTYSEDIVIPIRFIFRKIILCRDLKISAEIAAQGKFDCVTTDGDQVSSKGWLKGGHHASSKSPMKMQQDKTYLIQKMDSIRRELSNLNQQIQNTDKEIIDCISCSQNAETKRIKAKETYDRLKYDLENIKEQLRILDNTQILERKNLQQLKLDLSNLQSLKQKLVEELDQDLNDRLTEADERQIEDLNKTMKKLRKELKTVFKDRKDLEKKKIDCENKLFNNLICKKKELKQKLQEISLEDNKTTLQELEYQANVIEEKIKKCKSDFELNETKYKDADSQKQQNLEELEILYSKLKPDQLEFEEKSKKLERLSSKIRILDETIDNTRRKIVELGPLSNKELHSKYQAINTKTLYKKLDNCRKNLKNFEHVNKKALDQYETFKDQRDNFFKRKEELDKANEKIEQLFNFLQQKKYDAVQFTFKQVSKYFTEIFSKIVPRGKAQLVMQQSNSQSENGSESTTSLDVENLTGIGIQVSFTSQTSSLIDYNQLSGGQKSLVALTLIFAIQKCDPAPFYLFDEIDGDLDTDHRRAVAQMIHELSFEAQFIIITHRPELLEYANQFYGVKFQNNKISSIFEISREEALKFIEPDQADEE
ncbi:structural maintenance of chromosomes protein 3-like [Phymastichus coffea]|uniref:structural maintenance of chromosomes protein 3-like n=1 Tax=Phymastichus coffea TaxID=108790 RepID=UPI00273C67C9|nr:structural maintenance of chromosomes protein 3-like [Phymastichus coffea]